VDNVRCNLGYSLPRDLDRDFGDPFNWHQSAQSSPMSA
jgi:hypothetical protein